jgi:signal transduction histidine kinase
MSAQFAQVWHRSLCQLAVVCVLLFLLLAVGTGFFFWQRKKLYRQADAVLAAYINGDYSGHLPQNREGGIFQLFSTMERLASMLQARHETEHAAKEFMKSTISDISHQLKTPLAALAMYQEIMEEEPDNPETVRQFTARMGTSLKRMEQLICSMLKITRLDAGNISFEKDICNVKELIAGAVGELTVKAGKEGKKILLEGNPEQTLVCDREWTGEAIGNIVKNALDHTRSGDRIHISWERTPAMLRILVADSGQGIAPEDIHHIFKRFYRSAHSLDTQGVGLGLSLAKSIVEGQGGILAAQSEPGQGALFTMSFLTEL